MFSDFRKASKYYDLCLIVNDEKIYVHKGVICEKSEFISKLCNSSFEEWPPINNLIIKLPDEITTDNLKHGIDYLYGDIVVDYQSAIKGLLFMYVKKEIIIDFIWKYLMDGNPTEFPSEMESIINVYGNNLPYVIDCFNNNWGCELPSDPNALESKIFYFDRVKRSQDFEFCGIKFNLVKFWYDRCEHFCKIYVDNSCEVTEPIKIRATFAAYYLDRERSVSTEIETVDPQNFKVRIMSLGMLENRLTFEIRKNIVKAALLVEKLPL